MPHRPHEGPAPDGADQSMPDQPPPEQEPLDASAYLAGERIVPRPLTPDISAADLIDDDAAAADPYDDEPPPYVVELMVSEGMYPNSHSDPPPGADGAQDEGGDALVASHEHYEEGMTAAIRDTGRLPSLPRGLAHEAG